MTQGGRPQKPLTVSEAVRKVQLSSNLLKTIGTLDTLDKLPSRQYESALNILCQRQTAKKPKYYKSFLQELLDKDRDMGPTLVMLCAVALGQAHIANMTKPHRSTLARQLITMSQEFNHTNLRGLTVAPTKRSECVPLDAHRSMASDEIPQYLPLGGTNAGAVLSMRDGIDLDHTEANGRRKLNLAISEAAFPNHESLEIEYMFSSAPVELMHLLTQLIPDAIQTSRLWTSERQANDPRTGCLATMIPQDGNADISITLWVGQQAGMEILNTLKLQPTWSSSLGHLSL